MISRTEITTLILNIIFVIDDLVPNFGPTIKVLTDFMKFDTKIKWYIVIGIHCLYFEKTSF